MLSPPTSRQQLHTRVLYCSESVAVAALLLRAEATIAAVAAAAAAALTASTPVQGEGQTTVLPPSFDTVPSGSSLPQPLAPSPMLNAANAEGVTPLLAAAAAGSHLCLQLLLRNHTSSSSGTAEAAANEDQRIEHAVGKPEGSISAAEDPWISWQDEMGNGALHYACRSGEPLTAVQMYAWCGCRKFGVSVRVKWGVCVSGGKEVCNEAPIPACLPVALFTWLPHISSSCI